MRWLAFLAFISVALAGCGGIGDSIGDAVAEKATDKILSEVEASINVKDAFIDGLEHVYVTFGEVSILNESNVWIPLQNSIERVDLLAFQTAGQFAEIARFTAFNINYSAIRLPILDVEAFDENGPVPLQINTEIIEIEVDFLLEQGFAALIDFDLAASFATDGTFDAAVKNVQLSSSDSDGDGLNDFEDTDDDNDGKFDHEDDDVDGNGVPDQPTTRKSSFSEGNVDDSKYARAPPKTIGQQRWEAEKFTTASKQRQGASGAVSTDSQWFLESSLELTLKQLRFFVDCNTPTDSRVVVRGWDPVDKEVIIGTGVASQCGWVLVPLDAVGTQVEISVESNAPVELDYVDLTSRPAPVQPMYVEGEHMTGGEKRVEKNSAAHGGEIMRDFGQGESNWTFDANLAGRTATVLAIQMGSCEQGGSMLVTFDAVGMEKNWLNLSYQCRGEIEFLDVGTLNFSGNAGTLQVKDYYGSLAVDYLLFE